MLSYSTGESLNKNNAPQAKTSTTDSNKENREPSSPAAEMIWRKTSTPSVTEDKGRGKFRIRLVYTPSKGKAPARKTSQRFDTRQEAEAAVEDFRLGWEGKKRCWEDRNRGQPTDDRVPLAATTSPYKDASVPRGQSSLVVHMLLQMREHMLLPAR